MDVNVFIEKFADCLNHTPASAINAETEYKKLEEWSSIFSLIVIAMVDEVYGKTLSAEDFRNTRSINDLFHLIQSK